VTQQTATEAVLEIVLTEQESEAVFQDRDKHVLKFKCNSKDARRYTAYLHNSLRDTFAKIAAMSRKDQKALQDLQSRAFTWIRYDFLSHLYVILVDHAVLFTRLRHAYASIFKSGTLSAHDLLSSICLLDTLTKCSEHISHCPDRVAFLFNSAWRFRSKEGTITLPAVEELLRGHKELSTSDEREGCSENKVTLYDLDRCSEPLRRNCCTYTI
jgi:hypothetical protein